MAKSKKIGLAEKKSARKGFSLIEILVTIVIVGVGLVGMTAFFNMNIQSQFEVKNEIIAANLAQEGVELVRNIRDYNVLSESDWYSNLFSNHLNGGPMCFEIDYFSLTTHTCSNAGSAVCLSGARYYQCASGSAQKTDFTREITISATGDLASIGGYLTVTSRVTWNGRTSEANLVLYNNQF